jgi:putative spermidine/putrescine transport system permease protein
VWLGILPFFLYAFAFLLLPAGQVLVGAFKSKSGDWSTEHLSMLFESHYLHAYENSIEISLVTAILGGVFGLLIAFAALTEGTPRWIRPALTTFSGVAANFGGIPLAAAWIFTLGTIGIVTEFLRDQLHYNIYFHGFTLFSKLGIEIAYMYFQLPLMFLVIAPAIDGMKREWREASSNLGASSFQYWRHIGLPVLMPSLLGAIVLLFGNAFAAYATAYGLTGGGIQLVPIEIGNVMSGNVLNDPHLGQALALGMFVVLALAMLVYIPLARRTARWMR